ncbi:hypothetical protein [Cytobacillus sp. FSL R5-0596]|uniref:hypothetical protein n=1 Tax=Cytobacillus sp. FSL R5-0596 TaxID=2954696 RepID=UPI0030FAB14B
MTQWVVPGQGVPRAQLITELPDIPVIKGSPLNGKITVDDEDISVYDDFTITRDLQKALQDTSVLKQDYESLNALVLEMNNNIDAGLFEDPTTEELIDGGSF